MTIVLFNYGRSSLRYLSAHPSFLPVWVDIRTQPFGLAKALPRE